MLHWIIKWPGGVLHRPKYTCGIVTPGAGTGWGGNCMMWCIHKQRDTHRHTQTHTHTILISLRCCVTVEMDVERARTCPILPLLSLQRLWVAITPARRCLLVDRLFVLVRSVQRCRFVPNPGQAARSAWVGDGGFFFCGKRLTKLQRL